MLSRQNPVLNVNLTSGSIKREAIDERVANHFLSGRGLGDWFLFRTVNPGETDPLSPENTLFFFSGLLSGTHFPGAVRNSLVSLNVLTGGYGESSSAGSFASALRKSGCEGILVSGRSPDPVYLWIDEGHVELRSGAHLCGKTTFEKRAAIREELDAPSASTCTIGQAGENLVRYALVNCDDRYSGRCGMGAVMGSKNLLAVAVRGSGSIRVHDPDVFDSISSDVRSLLASDPSLMNKARYGLGRDTEAYNDMGLLFIKNFQEVDFDRVAGIGYNAVKKYYERLVPCPTDCPVRCNRLARIPEGEPYGGTAVSSLEATPAYEMAHLCVDDIRTVLKAFELCNGYGIDIHSWSTCMSWAIECFERGIITRKDTDGLSLHWGDGPMLLESIRRIAKREGAFAGLLAEGVARASKKLGRGSEQYAMQMKGMEIDDELRVDKGMTFGILTESRGTGHTLGAFFGSFDKSMSPEKAKKLFGTEHAAFPHSYDGKADLVVLTERYGAIQDCLGICWFASHRAAPLLIDRYNMQTYALLVSAVTGLKLNEEDLIRTAERIITLEKTVNILAGQTREDEFPPDRFFQPIPNGRSGGMALDRDELDKLFRRHSELHGWDPATGIPLPETLRSLDLPEAEEALEKAGCL
jgi:aldehyde:ferredoxin oxidoreductase